MNKPVVVEVYRGSIVESKHYVHIIGVNWQGEKLFSKGDFNYETYWRSSAKPFQVLPLLEAGGIEKFGLNQEEIALMAASHKGEQEHIKVIENILKKIGMKEEMLDYGISQPLGKQKAHHPCSGKHVAMLALIKILGLNIENYRLLEHPVQQIILDIICQCTQLEKSKILIAIDGCGVPVFGMPIYNMALAYAWLSKPSLAIDNKRFKSLEQVLNAMTSKPFYVAGSNKIDTSLMEVTKGKLVAKIGAEGVYCVGIVGKGIGIALKVEDGNHRAIAPVIVPLLKMLGFLTEEEYIKLKKLAEPVVKNNHNEVVGSIKTRSLSIYED